jgi:hypothetical protein
MRINRWILSLVLFVIFHSLRANDFAAIEKVIQIKGFIDDEIGGILQADDGNYYMILNIVSTVVQIDSLNFDSNEWANRYPDMCIVRFNSELEVDTMFMIEENVYGYTIEIYDGTIRVGGRYFFSDDPRIFYGHYTLDGEKIWSKSIYTDFNLFSRYDWEDRSTYFVASSLYDWIHEDIIYKQENGYRTSVFGKVSEDGQLLWTNALYGNGKKTFQGQWARNNGSYLLSYAYKCDTLRFNQTEIVSNAVDGMDKKIFIKFDKTGKVTGHTEMYGKDLYNGLMRLIDDKIYTRVYFEEKMYWGHDSIVAPEGEYHSRYFVRLNIDGSIESKLFCELSFDNLSQLPDGNFVVSF